MGTRGFITFIVDGQEKTAYNHFDSYPSGLGQSVLDFLRLYPEVLAKARDLRVIDGRTPPTAEDIERLRPYTDLSVSEQSTQDWYCLLRNTQGDIKAMLEGGIIEDASSFPLDSLFAEWGYVLDLDTMTFEVYEGFQTARHDKGRFASRYANGEYYPVALKAYWPLSQLPTNADFIAATDPEE